MKKLVLAASLACFMLNMVGMDNKGTKKETTDVSKVAVPEIDVSPTSGAHDYETYKAAEKVSAIVDEVIDVVLKEKPEGFIEKGSDNSRGYNENCMQMYQGLYLQNNFSEMITAWGKKELIGSGETALIDKVLLVAQKRITVALLSENKYGENVHKILSIDGKKLPEPIIMPPKNYLSRAIVKKTLKKHQERYQKEIRDEVVPFIPVRAVAEIVTAYLVKR